MQQLQLRLYLFYQGGQRGRLINTSERRQTVELITEAVDAGARLYKACEELCISKRTYNRWKNSNTDYMDKRPSANVLNQQISLHKRKKKKY